MFSAVRAASIEILSICPCDRTSYNTAWSESLGTMSAMKQPCPKKAKILTSSLVIALFFFTHELTNLRPEKISNLSLHFSRYMAI